MQDKKKILGLLLTLDKSTSAQEIVDFTRLDLKKVRRHLRQLKKEGKIVGERKFRIYKKDNVHNVRSTNSTGV